MKTTDTKPEPWKYTHLTKTEAAAAWSEWFESKRDEWDLFTVTVVYRSGGSAPNPSRWESEYRTRVLGKVRRRMETNSNNQEHAIPFDHFYYYEKDEASIFRKTGSRKPHHIHGIIPIRKEQLYRFWSIDNNALQPRLRKDIESIDTVQSIDIQFIETDRSIDWVKYCQKGKSIYELN